jgi:hypothetical protein
MRRSISKRLLEPIAVLFIVLTAMFFASPRLTSQYLHRPQGSVFVGMTTYFEDFYYYLDQFYQGGHGNWLTENRFSIEHFKPTLIYLNNIIFGKIGGIFGLESFQSYNLFGAIFKLLFMISAYVMIRWFFPASLFKRISVYLIFLFSTSIPNIIVRNGSVIFSPSIDLFQTENRVLSRFSTLPNNMFINFLFIVLFLILISFFSRKYSLLKHNVSAEKSSYPQWIPLIKTLIILLPVYILFALGDLVEAMVLLGLFIILYLKYSPQEKPFRFLSDTKVLIMALLGIFIVIFLYIYRTVNVDPVYMQATQWDISQYLQQIKALGIVNFIKGFGLQMPLFFYGYWILIRKHHKTILEESALILTAFGILGYGLPLLFQIPVPGFRFLFPALYVPIAIIAWYAIEELSIKFHRRNMMIVLLAVYLVINLISLFPGWYEQFKPLKEPDYHFAYIPDELYQGLVFLRTAEPRDGNVLASPRTSIDLMIPGIAGRYTYSGHFLTTYNSKEKDELAQKFFFEWTDNPETHEFLKKNNIRFIVVTKYSQSLEAFKIYYPFLKTVFANPTVTIFRYDPV